MDKETKKELDKKKEDIEKEEEVKKPLLEKAWDKLHFEGSTPTMYFWCTGFTRSGEVTTLIDAVIYKLNTQEPEYTFEGAVKTEEPILIHPIIK